MPKHYGWKSSRRTEHYGGKNTKHVKMDNVGEKARVRELGVQYNS